MKKSPRQQAKTTSSIQPISTDDLRRIVGGGLNIYIPPVKSKGGLDNG